METSHVTEEIRKRVVDLRGEKKFSVSDGEKIYFTDAVSLDISATEIRRMIREGDSRWRELVSAGVSEYIVKQKLYLD
jgi:nicotinic acid mononucleotide adenylyltransferase